MATIADNLQAVKARIERAALAAQRDPARIALLAVSKAHPAACIAQARAAGQRAFGENYIQEALEKMQVLDGASGGSQGDLEWHFIGPLQSNKTRFAAERFDWVHSVSSEKIARRLSEQRAAGRSPLNVLIQVNVSGEASKAGVPCEEAFALAQRLQLLNGIRLRGLMAIPEASEDAARQRARFSQVRQTLEEMNRGGFDLDTLSMGMSADLEAAIAEGATLVRIGTAIFGPRKAGQRAEPALAGRDR
jgi:pyridoxal phosphate enzyme (YggS family)